MFNLDKEHITVVNKFIDLCVWSKTQPTSGSYYKSVKRNEILKKLRRIVKNQDITYTSPLKFGVRYNFNKFKHDGFSGSGQIEISIELIKDFNRDLVFLIIYFKETKVIQRSGTSFSKYTEEDEWVWADNKMYNNGIKIKSSPIGLKLVKTLSNFKNMKDIVAINPADNDDPKYSYYNFSDKMHYPNH